MDVRFLSKTFLLGLFLALSNPLIPMRMQSIDSLVAATVFSVICIISIASFLALAYQKNSNTKVALSIALVFSTAISLSYYQVTHQYLEFYELETMFHAANNLSDALMTFDGVWYAIVISILGLIALLMPLKNGIFNNKVLLIVPSFITCSIIITILYMREGNGTKALPTQYTALSYSLVILKDAIFNPMPDDIPNVEIVHSHPAFDGDLIMIMDESIRGDFLDINHALGVKTSLSKLSRTMQNFGIASSATNCSDTSNLSLRRGVRRESYLQDKHNNPTFWQYAKKAGYRTVYLDAQLTDGRLGNHMTESERDYIDFFYQVSDDENHVMHKDNILAERLIELLNNDTNDFIYINKMGAHFPFEGKYPESQATYLPVMDSVAFNRSYPEPGELPHPEDYSRLMRLKFINSYKNALSWNVTNFFDVFSSSEKSNSYVMIYTSDHGQSFHDDGRKGYGTHCTIEQPDPEEGIVPLIVFSNESSVLDALKAAKELNENKVSHYNLAPTLYEFMGYDLNLFDNAEKTLFEPMEPNNQKFNSKYFVRFGSQPIWNSIEMGGRDSLTVWDDELVMSYEN